MIRHTIETFWKELHLKRGYSLVYSPHIAKLDLWKTSGHYDFYRENMYDQMAVSGGCFGGCGVTRGLDGGRKEGGRSCLCSDGLRLRMRPISSSP